MVVLIEVLPAIKTANVYVKSNLNYDEVILLNNEVTLENSDENDAKKSLKLKLSKNIIFEPESTSGLKLEDGWLSFRAQLQDEVGLSNSTLAEIMGKISSLSLNSSFEDLGGKEIVLQCKCGYDLTETVNFDKFCKAPTDWEGSENWFCHCHGHHNASKLGEKTSLPKTMCFFDDLTFCIRKESLIFTYKDDNLIGCPKCGAELGFSAGNFDKFWANEVQWKDGKEILKKSQLECVLSLLNTLEKENFSGTSAKLLIETKNNPKNFLYISTIDSFLTVFVSGDSPLAKNGNKILKDQIFSDSDSSNFKKSKLGDETLVKLKCKKVLFEISTSKTEKVLKWQKDIYTINVIFSQCLFEFVCKILENSNKCIPEHFGTVNGLRIGYIANE